MCRSVLNPTPSRLTLRASARNSAENVAFEHEELAQIYVQRGVEPGLARQVAQQLMAKDALGAHARDELGISEITTARPIQAALTSAATFTVGAALPLLMVVVTPDALPGGWPSQSPRCYFSRSWERSAREPAAPMSSKRQRA